MWSAGMNSFNHYAYGAIGEWMYRVMAGIEADESAPGFRHSVIYPRIGGNLSFTEGQYHSVYGEIRVKWEVEDAHTVLTVQIPANTTASIRLDEAGEVLENDGLAFEKKEHYLEAEAGSGVYRIVFQRK
jgi:alpha-L-rhamnosidase